MNEDARDVVPVGSGSQSHERLGHRGCDRAGRLCFDERERAIAGGHDQIDLEALLVPEVVDLLPTPGIQLLLDDFRGDEPLEERTEKRRPTELAFGRDAEESI
jgi:hypothetical protein